MVQFPPPTGGPWNPLRGGASKALSIQAGSLGKFHVEAVSSASEAASLKSQRARRTSFQRSVVELLQKFPLKVACTAGTLCLTGDTIAQVTERVKRRKALEKIEAADSEELAKLDLWNHDLFRAMRMGSYGFLLYAPGTQVWYECLDRILVGQSVRNIALKVAANQLILGPVILMVVFSWNYFWMGKLKELPAKYRKDLGPGVINSWKFWLPATCLNFWVVPLHTRVAFMSTCGIFWNFYLSSNIGR